VKLKQKILLYVTLGFFFVLMLRITLQYIPIRTDAGFLQLKQQYLDIIPWKIAFFVHVFTSIFVLAAGFTQFTPSILKKHKSIHRTIGKAYVFNVLFITGPASFVMALFANGGISSRLGFSILSILWIFTTAMAWRTAMQKKFSNHKMWMYRSYALTLSALTLRLWKWLLVLLFHMRPMDAYMIVAWLGFVPNLLLAELLIARTTYQWFLFKGAKRPARLKHSYQNVK